MSKTYTIRELAEEVGVTKTAVRKLFSDSFRKQFLVGSGNPIQVSEDGANVIRKHFDRSTKVKDSGKFSESSQKDSGNKDELVSVLKEQLANRNNELAEMRELLNRNQELLLNTQNENRKLLALQMPETKPETVVSDNDKAVINKGVEQEHEAETKPETEKKHWWQRL